MIHRFLIALVLLVGTPAALWAAGEEHLGNAPVNAANYQKHAGILDVINDDHRVYRWWVNGNEKFFFRGDTIALNAALENYAKIESKTLEVVLRPGPATTSTFRGDREIPFNWNLHFIGGITGHLATRDLGDRVWPTHPVLYVYVGGTIQLSELAIPKGVKVSQLSDLHQRYSEALKSKDQTVRGWTCGELAKLDRFNTDSMNKIAGMLEDDVGWVRLNAAGALASFGAKAQQVSEKLRAASQTEDESLKKRCEQTLQKISAANPEEQAEQDQAKMLATIAEFCQSLQR
ncbi:MAG: hypothetical protein MI861_14140 [Pirellulales bacterium]|nr:hypothetical protein [Pirellulales bacterium]